MRFQIASAVIALSSLSSLVSAQVMHVVSVGQNGQLAFCPEQITANPGDLVQFQFYPKNHSVIQGFFAEGCTPISQAPPGTAQQGSFSGFMPVSNDTNTTTIPTFTITVNGTGPEWFYCGQAKHCQSGMVFAINPTAAKSLAGFKANCANATENIVPGSPGESSSSPPPQSAVSSSPVVTTPIVSFTSSQTSLPIQTGSWASTTRVGGWIVATVAGSLTVWMLL